MAVARSDRKQAQLRNELRNEREQLAEAVESLRGGVDYQTCSAPGSFRSQPSRLPPLSS
jgi:hypothetical protein